MKNTGHRRVKNKRRLRTFYRDTDKLTTTEKKVVVNLGLSYKCNE